MEQDLEKEWTKGKKLEHSSTDEVKWGVGEREGNHQNSVLEAGRKGWDGWLEGGV